MGVKIVKGESAGRGKIITTHACKRYPPGTEEVLGNALNCPYCANTKSTSDLIMECNAAASKMGDHNPNKTLILNCAYAIRQLVDRLAMHEDRKPS